MKEQRPILFGAPMVRAILDGRKTQTRRAVKPMGRDDAFVLLDGGDGWWPYRSDDGESSVTSDGMESPHRCPYGVPGGRLWVKETWSHSGDGVWSIGAARMASSGSPVYRADGELPGVKWWSPIHMPREFSRITLEVTGVRVERLQDISQSDAEAEGVDCIKAKVPTPRDAFRYLWDDINDRGSWDTNPWVWVIEFNRVSEEGALHGNA
jgi:hypothetical protein